MELQVEVAKELEGKIEKHDTEIHAIFEAIRQLMASFGIAQDAIPSEVEGWRRRPRSRNRGSGSTRSLSRGKNP